MRARLVMLALALALILTLGATLLSGPGAAAPSRTATPAAGHAGRHAGRTRSAGTAQTGLPPIRHVFVIVLENESASATFPASGPAPAPYLADTMVSEGAYLPDYYAVGHNSNDNYIAMISGQAPNVDNSDDCLFYGDFPTDATTGAPYDQQEGVGCIYPADIPNIASQLDSAGLSWRDYNEDMGNDPSRESSTCGHPAPNSVDHTQTEVDGDAYATRHNPFVYFHDIIDNPALCDSHVVNLDQLQSDLQSASSTPNYVFITPNLCHDGHDATCATPGENGGFTGINDFLSKYVPMITGSPAFKDQNGLLITTFDEAATSDASSCCGEIPGPGEAAPGLTGSGGGRVGAVLISPCIAPGTVSHVAYNHYSMLGSVENLFGLAHLGYAQLPGESYFGSDIFTRSCAAAPTLTLREPRPRAVARGSAVAVSLRFSSPDSGVTYTVQMRRLTGSRAETWRTLASASSATSQTVSATAGATYQFRVRATNGIGLASPYASATLTLATLAHPAGARLTGHWRTVRDAGAPYGSAEAGSAGARLSYRFDGGTLALLSGAASAGARVTLRLDRRLRTIELPAAHRPGARFVVRFPARVGHHFFELIVRSGTLRLRGLSVADLS